LDAFRNLVIRQVNGGIIRLGDIGEVALGADSYESRVRMGGTNGVFVGIQVAPTANLLSVVKGIKAVMPEIQSQLPQGLNVAVAYDSSTFVTNSIREVAITLIEALIIVMLVIFAFLGSPRSVLIPVVAIPLSLVGTLAIMLALGFSINLLTLLALVLAIGLVVDDAIIVVENVNRHLADGMPPIAAASTAARELGSPIIAMTVVLLAVYIPIGFQGGLTGALFTEFAFTLAGAVTVSAVIALTLSPMMCSRLLHAQKADQNNWEARIIRFIDRRFQWLHDGYQRLLQRSLRYTPVTAAFVVAIIISIALLYRSAQSELAPTEDQSFVLAQATYAPDATLQQKLLFGSQAFSLVNSQPGVSTVFQIDAPGQSITGVPLVPPDQRKFSAIDFQRSLQAALNTLPAQRFAVFQQPSLPGARGLPVQFAIESTEPALRLNEVSQAFLATVAKSGMFMFIDSDMKYDAPQSVIEIDRDKAAQLGLTMSQVGSALSGLLGGGYVNYFSMQTRSYKVIPQVERVSRLNVDQLLDYPIASIGGVPIPLSTIATVRHETVPETLNHFQQASSATLSGVPSPGVSLADALNYLKATAAQTLPQGYSLDYAGQLRQYLQESAGVMGTFGFAIIIVFLALAALFESFRDPLVILISVPLSIAGALIFIAIGVHGATLNIYTQVGLVTLIGLISKHGILIVEVANEEQHSGKTKAAAIVAAASVRLRPILMTTAAMVLGVVPLVIASGAGAAGRQAMGLVIFTGMSIGTLFTLFVVPAWYMLLGANHEKSVDEDAALDEQARKLDEQMAPKPAH
jgi:multidrug efflux pump